MKKHMADVILWSEILLAGGWMIGADLAGAVLVPWLWCTASVIIGALSLGMMAGLHKNPVIAHEAKEKKIFSPLGIATTVTLFAVLLVKSHFALAMVVVVNEIVFRSFIWAVKKG